MEIGGVDTASTHSPESFKWVVPMVDEIVVAGVLVPNPGVILATKICEFLINLDPKNFRKTIGCLLN